MLLFSFVDFIIISPMLLFGSSNGIILLLLVPLFPFSFFIGSVIDSRFVLDDTFYLSIKMQ